MTFGDANFGLDRTPSSAVGTALYANADLTPLILGDGTFYRSPSSLTYELESTSLGIETQCLASNEAANMGRTQYALPTDDSR
jgi:hypothetical protein